MAQLYNLLHIVRYIPLILTVTKGSFADTIWPTDENANIVRHEKDTVTLKCSYEASSQFIYLYWYKQYPNSGPQFLLYKGAGSYSSQERKATDTRLETKTSGDSTELTIRGLKLSDSALYHCALEVEDGDWSFALTFGKPITLRVEPTEKANSLPTLSILTSWERDDKKEKLDTCLAADFFPKKGELSLSTDNAIPTTHSVENAALSSAGTYYYAAFSKEGIKSCVMGSKTVNKTDVKSTMQTPSCDQSSTFNISTSNNLTSPNEIKISGDPKGNTMLLIVTGLRLLLAKAVGINIMMTIKAFLV